MGHATLQGSCQSKCWGSTRCVFQNHTSEVHIIQANKNCYCSQHIHMNKWNRFVVLQGVLKVILYKEEGNDETVLTVGQFSDVPPGVEHRFEALEDTLCLEIYWVDGLDPKDIVRKTNGGHK